MKYVWLICFFLGWVPSASCLEREALTLTKYDLEVRLEPEQQRLAVRGIGNVVWYPVATESANLSEGNSLFETLGRWKQREQNAEMRIAISHASEGESRPPTVLCSVAGQRRREEISSVGKAVSDCSLFPVGLGVPGFLMARYEVLENPQIAVFYRQDHQRNAEKFAQAAE